MAVWVVSYDLRSPGQNYQGLYDAIKSVPWAHVLDSVWLIEAEGPASRIRDILKQKMDKNDGLIVVEFTEDADWALTEINQDSIDWVQAKRP